MSDYTEKELDSDLLEIKNFRPESPSETKEYKYYIQRLESVLSSSYRATSELLEQRAKLRADIQEMDEAIQDSSHLEVRYDELIQSKDQAIGLLALGLETVCNMANKITGEE